jgi:TolA-binding protein
MKKLILSAAIIFTASIANASICDNVAKGSKFALKQAQKQGINCGVTTLDVNPVTSGQVTLSMAEINKIENHIKSLNERIAKLEKDNKKLEKQVKTQASSIDKLMKGDLKLPKKVDKDSNDVFTIDSFYTKNGWAYVELNVTEQVNKITCRVKNSSGQTIKSDITYRPTVGWHTQMMSLPSKNMSGLKVNCQSQ